MLGNKKAYFCSKFDKVAVNLLSDYTQFFFYFKLIYTLCFCDNGGGPIYPIYVHVYLYFKYVIHLEKNIYSAIHISMNKIDHNPQFSFARY